MAKEKIPKTPALRFLEQKKISFISHLYPYEEKGGAKAAAHQLSVPENQVIKTIAVKADKKKILLVLMHGDREISLKALGRSIGAKSTQMCSPQEVNKSTGYLVGGTSPFGTKTTLPVYIEKSILDLDTIWVNGGKRGLLVELRTIDLVTALQPQIVESAQPLVL